MKKTRENPKLSRRNIGAYGTVLVLVLIPLLAYLASAVSITVWDTSNSSAIYVNYTKFSANFTDAGISVNGSGQYCRVAYNKTGIYSQWFNMTFNADTLLYEVVANGTYRESMENEKYWLLGNGSMPTVPYGNYTYNISCYNSDGSMNTSAVANISVSNYSTGGINAFDQENDTETSPLSNDPLVITGENTYFYANYTMADGTVFKRQFLNYTGATSNIRAIEADDIDGDGDMEVVIGNYAGGLKIYNSTGGNETPTVTFGTLKIYDIEISDLDNNGNKEIVFVEATDSNGDWLYIANRTLGLLNKTSINQDPQAFVVGDINGDGLKEIVVGTTTGANELQVYNYTAATNLTLMWTVDSTITNDAFSANSLRLYDINRDGMLEIITGWYAGYNTTAYYGNGTRIFTVSMGDNVYALDADDIDNDGVVEIVAGGDQGLMAVYNSTGGTETSATTVCVASGLNWFLDVAIEDLNNDGTKEIVGTCYSNQIVVANRTLGRLSNMSSCSSASEIFVDDINNDGYKEILTGCSGSGTAPNAYSLNSTNGLNLLWRSDSTSTTASNNIGIVDMNRDGRLDVLAGYDDSKFRAFQDVGCVITFSNGVYGDMAFNSTGNIYEYNRTFAGGNYTWNVTCAAGGYEPKTVTDLNITVTSVPDFNVSSLGPALPNYWNNQTPVAISINVSNAGDSNATGVNVSCYWNNSTTPFQTYQVNLSAGASNSSNCTWAITSEAGNYSFSVSVDPSGNITEMLETNNNMTSSVIINQTTSVDAFDEEDDEENQAAAGFSERNLTINEQVRFWANWTNSLNAYIPSVIARNWTLNVADVINALDSGDIDNDGTVEIVAGDDDGDIGIWNVTGSGAERPFTGITGASGSVYDIEISDLDNDGVKEIIFIDTTSDLLLITNSTLGLVNSTDLGISDPYTLRVGDINNDGLKEIVVGTLSGTNELQIYNFTASAKLRNMWNYDFSGTGTVYFKAIDLYDVDGNGVLDVVVGSTNNSLVVLYGNGTQMFSVNTGDAIYSVKAGNVDNDGIVEIVVGDDDGDLRVYNSTGGNETNWVDSGIGSSTGYVYDITIDDLDGNGNKEIIMVETGRDMVYIFNATLSSITNMSTGQDPYEVETADVNNDGYKEIILGTANGTNELRVYNFTAAANMSSVWSYDFQNGLMYNVLDVFDIDNNTIPDIAAGGTDQNITLTRLSGCSIRFNDSTTSAAMLSNNSAALYQYNRSFSSGGMYMWNVTCNMDYYETKLITYENVTVNSPPAISIIYPLNNTNYTADVNALNYTVSSSGTLDKCWHSNSSGAWNSSVVAAGINFTGVDSIEGRNNWTVYCNDSFNYMGTGFVTFFKDTIAPLFTSVANQTAEYFAALGYDIDATDASGISCFSVNDTTNFSINCTGYLRNNTLLVTGIYWLNVSVNDTLGNRNSTVMQVNVSDTVAPSVALNSPASAYANNSAAVLNVTLNCSATDLNLLFNVSLYITNSSNQSFSLNRTTNISGTSNSTNWTLELGVGNYTWNCKAFDSAGNYNFSSMNRTITLNYTGASAPLSSDSGQAEWRMQGKYLNRTGWDGTSFSTVPGLNRATYTTGGQIFYSTPAVANGSLFVGSEDYRLYQLNASNVSQRISLYAAAGAVNTPAVVNGYVYVGGGTKLYQLNVSNISQVIASYSAGSIVYSSPAVAGGYVYFGSIDKKIYQVNASNVSQLIAYYTTGDSIEGSSPAVAGSYVYIGSRDKKVYQLNASNVSQLIAYYTTGAYTSQSSPAVANGSVYITSQDMKIYQLNASNVSQLIANYTLATGSNFLFSTPSLAYGFVYIATYTSGMVYQLNASNVSQVISTYNAGNSFYFASPAIANGYLYIGSMNNKVYQLNATNISRKIAEFSAGDKIYAGAAVAGGYVYIGSRDKKLYQLNASNISLDNADLTPPTINITNPANDTFVNGNVTISAAASDSIAMKNVTFEYSNSTTIYTLLCADTTSPYSCIWQTALFSNSSEGYDIRATAYDTSSNNASKVLHLAIDKSIPVTENVTVTYPSGQVSARNSQSINVSISATDSNGSGMNNTIIDLTLANGSGNNTMVFASGSKTSGLWSHWNMSIRVNANTGSHQLPVYARDNATPLNNIKTSDRFYITVDNQPPFYSELQDYGPVYNREEITFSVRASDNIAAESYIFSTNMSGGWVNDTAETITDSSEPIFVEKEGRTGNHSYRFYLFDGAGNVNATEIHLFEILGNRTQFTILLYNLTESAISTESDINFTYLYYNGTAINCSFYTNSELNKTVGYPANGTTLNFSQTFAEGTYTWFVSCFDNATSLTYSSAQRIFTVDFKPSFGTVENQTVEYGSPLAYTVVATDSINMSCFTVNDTTNFNINCSGYLQNNTALATGIYWLNITANDSVSNTNSTIMWVNVSDTIYPMISFANGVEADNSYKNQSFVFANVTVTEINEANITFRIFNGTSSVNTTVLNAGSRTLNWTSQFDGRYYYNVTVCDNAGNCNSTQTLSIVLDTGLPNATLISPGNNSYVSNTTMNFTANISDSIGIKNATLFVYNSTGSLVNQTTLEYSEGIVGRITGIVVQLIDGIYRWFFLIYDRTGNIFATQNYTITIDTTSPNITLNSPASAYANNSAAVLNVTLNCSATDLNLLFNVSLYITNSSNQSFSLNRTTNISGTSNSTNWTLELGVGNYTWNCKAFDSAGNYNFSSMNRTITLNYTDSDGDGIPDDEDRLEGNESSVNTTGIELLNITIGGNSTNGTYNGTREVVFYDAGVQMVNFTHNFSESELDLRRVTILKASNYIIVNLHGQIQSDKNKTIYIADNEFVSLCTKDAEIISIENMTSGCNGENETNFSPCIGNGTGLTINGIVCSDEGNQIRIDNMRNSAVRGEEVQVNQNTSSTLRSDSSYFCMTNWTCTQWGPCADGMQTRSCARSKKDCITDIPKPPETQECNYSGASNASSSEIRNDSIKQTAPAVIPENTTGSIEWGYRPSGAFFGLPDAISYIILIALIIIAVVMVFSAR